VAVVVTMIVMVKVVTMMVVVMVMMMVVMVVVMVVMMANRLGRFLFNYYLPPNTYDIRGWGNEFYEYNTTIYIV